MRILVSLIILVGVIACTGCQQNPNDAGAPSNFTVSPAVTQPSNLPTRAMDTPDRMSATMTKNPERIPPTVVTTPVTGEVPTKLLDSILKDLAERTGSAPEKITLIEAQAIVWNDGSLGCPQPGVMYTMALVNGFQVILEVGGQKYDYHASESGYFFLCEGGLPPFSPQGTPNS